VEHFQYKLLRLFLCCCPTFLAGIISLGVNMPSSSGNVYLANGQTDRMLVPYCQPLVLTRLNTFESEDVNFIAVPPSHSWQVSLRLCRSSFQLSVAVHAGCLRGCLRGAAPAGCSLPPRGMHAACMKHYQAVIAQRTYVHAAAAIIRYPIRISQNCTAAVSIFSTSRSQIHPKTTLLVLLLQPPSHDFRSYMRESLLRPTDRHPGWEFMPCQSEGRDGGGRVVQHEPTGSVKQIKTAREWKTCLKKDGARFFFSPVARKNCLGPMAGTGAAFTN
jgi:hypothetical protein